MSSFPEDPVKEDMEDNFKSNLFSENRISLPAKEEERTCAQQPQVGEHMIVLRAKQIISCFLPYLLEVIVPNSLMNSYIYQKQVLKVLPLVLPQEVC